MKRILIGIILTWVAFVATFSAQTRPRVANEKRPSLVERDKQIARDKAETMRRNKIKADYYNLRTLELKENLARLQHQYGLELCGKDEKCKDKFRNIYLLKSLDLKINKQRELIDELKEKINREKKWRTFAVVPILIIR